MGAYRGSWVASGWLALGLMMATPSLLDPLAYVSAWIAIQGWRAARQLDDRSLAPYAWLANLPYLSTAFIPVHC